MAIPLSACFQNASSAEPNALLPFQAREGDYSGNGETAGLNMRHKPIPECFGCGWLVNWIASIQMAALSF